MYGSTSMHICPHDERAMSIWSLYVLRDETNSLYAGITTDVERRLRQHRSKRGCGAKYSRFRQRLDLVYCCELGDRSLATRAEYRFKRLKKAEKERLVALKCSSEELLGSLDLKDESEHR